MVLGENQGGDSTAAGEKQTQRCRRRNGSYTAIEAREDSRSAERFEGRHLPVAIAEVAAKEGRESRREGPVVGSEPRD
jgi:hypothetical protein